jgi:hypothetical protein
MRMEGKERSDILNKYARYACTEPNGDRVGGVGRMAERAYAMKS